MTLQPSEFLKPCFAVVTAWLISEGARARAFPGRIIACVGFALIALLLKSQPDMGMLAVVGAVFFVQLFVGGLNLFMVGVSLAGIGCAAVGAYSFFPHVRSRVTRFLDPASGDSYQVNTALEAFGNGGLLGRGPGEGRVKDVLPDAHADFVFARHGRGVRADHLPSGARHLRLHRAARACCGCWPSRTCSSSWPPPAW